MHHPPRHVPVPFGVLTAFLIGLLASTAGALPVEPWPAESWAAATNLTSVEGPGANDFYVDLSGAYWSPATHRMWLVRNGPGNTTSKVWALVDNGMGGYIVDTRDGLRAEWTEFNDAEAITQADPASDTVFIMAEGEEVIRQYNMAVYGTVQLVRTYNTLPFLPVNGGSGSEGLAFVPDWALHDGGFVTPAGAPYTSQRGMGGVFFVGHQNGGRVYVFDCSPTSTAFTFVGAYLTGGADTSEVTFDPTNGHLWLFHGNDVNTTEEVAFSSTILGGERRLTSLHLYDRPTGSPTSTNLEGFAVRECVGGHRQVMMTVDGGGATSLVLFRQFPCTCPGDFNANGAITVQDIFDFIGAWFAGNSRTDFNHDAVLTVQDFFSFLAAWFAGC